MVAHSSCESEYIVLDDVAREAIYILHLIEQLRLRVKRLVTILSDSKGARHWATNRRVNQRSKHIAIRYHYIRDLIESGTILVDCVDTE